MKKIIVFIVFTLGLIVLGDRLSGAVHQFQVNSMMRSFILIKENILFILVTNVLYYIFELLRLKLIGKIFKLNFSLKECLGGIFLNLLFGWISPMAILGAPAMAWYFYKRGYPLVESISVSFVRSFTIIIVSALTTITIYTFNLQGTAHSSVLQEKVFQVLCGISVYIGGLVVLSYLPLKFVKKIKFLDKLTSQIRTLIMNGKILMLPVMAFTLVTNFLLVSFIMYKGADYYDVYGPLLSQVMLFLSYMLLMPTPGAAGLAEVGAPMIFNNQIPGPEIVSIVTAMRFSSIGLQVFTGLMVMTFLLKEKLTLDELKVFKRSSSL